MKKILSLMLVFTLILVGCGSDEAVSDVVELEFATWAGGEELEELQEIVDRVNEENSDLYHITLVSIPSDYEIKLQTQISANDAPDIMWLGTEFVLGWAEEGALLDLTPYMEESELLDADMFYDSAIGAVTNTDGEIYGVPWIANPVIIYYNKDIVDEEDQARLDETLEGNYLTWDEFYDMAKKYHDPENGQYGTLLNGWPPLEMFIWGYGGEVQNEDGTLGLDSDATIEALDFLIMAIVDDPITPDQATIDSVGYTETFQLGNTAFFFGGVSDRVEYVGDEPVDFEIGHAVVPNGGTDVTYTWTASYVISSQTENPDVAYQAVEDLAIETFKWKVVPPIKIEYLPYDDYESYLADYAPEKSGMGDVIEISLELGKSDNHTVNSGKIYGIMWEELYAPILNASVTGAELDSQELLDNALERLSY